MPAEKAIWFHVGLGKTASTWLQNKVFPNLQGVHYLPPGKYRNCLDIIGSTDYKKYFVSREMDQQLEREMIKFSAQYPDAQTIIVLRSNESWITSQYRRFLKNGYAYTFGEFFNIDDDSGFWKISDAAFYPKLLLLERYFTRKPLVLFYEDMRRDPFAFIDKIASSMGATYQRNRISLEPHHTSYEEKQLKAMLKIAPVLFSKNPKYSGTRINTWLRRRSRMLLCYFILYPATLFPKSFFSKKPFIDPGQLEKIKKYFEHDRLQCEEYAAKNN